MRVKPEQYLKRRPWVPLLWREPGTVQVGLPPFQSLTVSGIGPAEHSALRAFDEPARIEDVLTACGPLANPERVYALIGCLHDAGAVAGADMPEDSTRRADSLRAASVHVIGTGPVGQCTALFLAAAGIGTVGVERGMHEQLTLESRQVHPLLDRSRRGAPRSAVEMLAAACALIGAQPRARTQRPPDLVVLTDDPWRSLGEQWQARGVAQLAVAADAGAAEIGPLVIPGITACLRCRELDRRARDASWPLLVAQLPGADRPLTRGDGRGEGAVMAMIAAAWATAWAVEWLRGEWDAEHPLSGAVIGLSSPQLAITGHRLTAHPACGCQPVG